MEEIYLGLLESFKREMNHKTKYNLPEGNCVHSHLVMHT